MQAEVFIEYELRFESLLVARRGLVFSCDEGGRVSLDRLTRRDLNNYLFARGVIGRDFDQPWVRVVT